MVFLCRRRTPCSSSTLNSSPGRICSLSRNSLGIVILPRLSISAVDATCPPLCTHFFLPIRLLTVPRPACSMRGADGGRHLPRRKTSVWPSSGNGCCSHLADGPCHYLLIAVLNIGRAMSSSTSPNPNSMAISVDTAETPAPRTTTFLSAVAAYVRGRRWDTSCMYQGIC